MAIFALEHGVDSIATGGPLVPFVMLDRAGQLGIERFAAETLEESLEKAKDFARAQLHTCDKLVVVFDGYITIEGDRSDALYGHAFERGAAEGSKFALRYKRSGLRRRNKPFANPIFCGNEPLN